MKNTFKYILAATCIWGIWSCNITGKDIGEEPIGSEIPDDTVIADTSLPDTTTNPDQPEPGKIELFVLPYELAAAPGERAEVKALVLDKNNNPMSDVSVRFKAVTGVVSAEALSDSVGMAYAIYQGIPLNTIDTIQAIAAGDTAVSDKATILLSGLKVSVTPLMQDAIVESVVPVEIKVTDGNGQPVPQVEINLTGMATQSGLTDGGGIFKTTLTANKKGQVYATAAAAGDTDTGYVEFWESVEDVVVSKVDTVRKMRIFSSRSQLKADNSDEATITVVLADEYNNPAVGDTVLFSSDLGIIDAMAIVDSNGRASVHLQSTPVNGTCIVTAKAKGRNLKVTTALIFSGITLTLVPVQTELKIGEWAKIEAFLSDGSDNPIGGDEVTFKLSGNGAKFTNDNNELSTDLGPNGRTIIQVTADKAGTVIIRAGALNTSDSVRLLFSNNTLRLSANKATIQVGGSDSAKITAIYVDGSNNALSNKEVIFASNAGVINQAATTTNSNGEASTWLRSADFAGVATVQATADQGVAQIKVNFTAGTPEKISLKITADNIGVKGGQAQLKATVQDENGNMVSGHDINFRILRGPGGGEYITKPVSLCQNGIAISQLNAGSLPSAYRGTEVEASINGIADTSKLTISGTPHFITVARPEDDTVVVKKAGIMDLSTFDYNIGAVVQDINGNYVADGTEVHFSAVVTGLAVARRVFVKWKGLDSPESIEPVFKTVHRDIAFEDINNNFTYDPAIDEDLDADPTVLRRGEDFNGNGVFEWQSGTHDYYFDFNGNGVCDIGVGENDTVDMPGLPLIFADLNGDGTRNRSELIIDHDGDGECDLPESGDFPFAKWEVRDWMSSMTFRDNEFAVVIEASAITKDGVAETKLTYPRQFARRLIVTINAEANGIRDKDGERFILPQIKGE